MKSPESIQKLGDELEEVRSAITEKRKELAALQRKEKGLMQRIETTWHQQFGKIVATIRGIAGE